MSRAPAASLLLRRRMSTPSPPSVPRGSPGVVVALLLRRRAGAVVPPVPLPPDLLSALVAYLRGEPTVTAAVGEKIFTGMADPESSPPFLVLKAYDEQLPGMSTEDQQVEVDVVINTADLDSARSIGFIAKAALDPVTFNPQSLARPALVYQGGEEYTMMRKNSVPTRQMGIARGGTYRYVERIECCFYVTPEL